MLIILAEQCNTGGPATTWWQDILLILGAVVVALCVGSVAGWTADRVVDWVNRWRGREPSERSRHAAKVYDEMFGRDD